MAKKDSEHQKRSMSKLFRGKAIFKPLNTGRIDERVACVREWVANIFFYTKNGTTIMIDAGYNYERLKEKMGWLAVRSLEALEAKLRTRPQSIKVITGHTGWSDDLAFVFAHRTELCKPFAKKYTDPDAPYDGYVEDDDTELRARTVLLKKKETRA